MASHSHPILSAIAAFTLGTCVAVQFAGYQHDGFVMQDTLNEQIVLNPTSDGRYHTCGYITEDGVTEYLDVYKERCPETDAEWHNTLEGDK